MTRLLILSALRRDAKAATIVEFALILPVLCMMLLGTLDLGYRSYVSSVVQGTLHDAARMATVGGHSMTEIDTLVKQRLSNFAARSTTTTEAASYFQFSGVSQPELIVGDTTPLNTYNNGDCFEDANGNNSYDTDRGAGGTGNSDDIVRYRVTITFPRVFPLGVLMGWPNTETLTSETVLRNQPYGGQVNSTRRISIVNGAATPC